MSAPGTARDPRLDPPPNLFVRALVRLAAWLLPLPHAQRPLTRVLVVRTDDRVGNALLTLPLVRALIEALPAAQIDLLLPSSRAQVARGLPGIRLIEFDKRDSFRHPIRFFRFLCRLRRTRYDAVIDAAHWHAFSLTSALLSRWSSTGRVIGSIRGPTALYTELVPLPETGTREARSKLRLGEALTRSRLETPAMETALGSSDGAREAARDARLALGIADRFAAFNPGARKADHRWGIEKFAALAKFLRNELGLCSLIFWGPGEEAVARELCARSDGAAIFVPPTDLDALAAHFRDCALAVTNDTGPMHLAVACGAPTLAIFLAADGARWGHDGPRFAAVAASHAQASPDAFANELREAEGAARHLLALTGEGAGGSFAATRKKEEIS